MIEFFFINVLCFDVVVCFFFLYGLCGDVGVFFFFFFFLDYGLEYRLIAVDPAEVKDTDLEDKVHDIIC
jgi:hypothetical protein